jgi:hypothetical protein
MYFSPLQNIYTDTKAYPAFYSCVKEKLHRTTKQPGRENNRTPPRSEKVKNVCICTSTSPYIFMAWDLSTGTTLFLPQPSQHAVFMDEGLLQKC